MGQRIWRTIDLDNKENKTVFNNNNKCLQIGLFEVIKFGLFEKNLNAFASDNFNEVDKTRLSIAELKSIISLKDTSEEIVYDAQGNETKNIKIEKRYLFNEDVKAYVLKEDWFINNYSGQLEKKIIGFAPLVLDRKTQKVVPLFWLYYNEWRELLLSFEAKNYNSDAVISYRTVLEKNFFISQISKENNIFDRSIKSYKHGQDPSLESEMIKEKIYNSERDLFQH